jgi:CxxC-x17-CxxC domain-containing protein
MGQKIATQVKCSECGRITTVPFKPKEGKPVYCKECLSKHKTQKNRPKQNLNIKKKFAWSQRRATWK